MPRRLIIAVSVVMVFAAATADAAVTPIPRDAYLELCPKATGKALQGDAANDHIRGTPQRDVLRGGGGRDFIQGREGWDCLFGQSGGDLIQGGGGTDLVLALRGDDVARGGPSHDIVKGGRGDDRLFGNGYRDESWGGKGDDFIKDLSHDDNQIHCGEGIDKVVTNKLSEVDSDCEHVTRE